MEAVLPMLGSVTTAYPVLTKGHASAEGALGEPIASGPVGWWR